MAKLPRVLQRIFGTNSTLDGTATGIAQIGSLAAASPVYSKDVAVLQALSNFLDGWGGCVLGDNSPTINDMTALHYVITAQLAYLFQAGIAEWDATTTYYIGSMVNDGTGKIYASIVDNNTNNAVTDLSKWRLATSNGPASATDNAVARFDGTTGQKIQNSLLTVDDSGVADGLTGSSNSMANALRNSTSKTLDAVTTTLGNMVIANNSGNITTNSTSFATMTNQSITIVTSGRPVKIYFVNGSASLSHFRAATTSSASAGGQIQILRGATVIALIDLSMDADTSGNWACQWSPSSVGTVDDPGAGTYVYSAKYKANATSSFFTAANVSLIAEEVV